MSSDKYTIQITNTVETARPGARQRRRSAKRAVKKSAQRHRQKPSSLPPSAIRDAVSVDGNAGDVTAMALGSESPVAPPANPRPRGVYSPIQRAGFELMEQNAVRLEPGGVGVVTDGLLVCMVTIARDECTCDTWINCKPRMRCAHIWAVLYYIDPPTKDEFFPPTVPDPQQPSVESSLTQSKILLPQRPSLIAVQRLDPEILSGLRGGYKRFAKQYDQLLRSKFTLMLPFVYRLFKEIEKSWVWRVQQDRGRLQIPLSGYLLAAYLYTYFGWSTRATEGFLQFLVTQCDRYKNLRYPGFARLEVFLTSKEATPLFHAILALTAEPFKTLCTRMVLAGDGTGAAADRNKFFDYRSQRCDRKAQTRPGRPWFHVHLVSCVDTMQTIVARVTRPERSEKAIFRDEMLPELVRLGYDDCVEQFLLDGGYNSTMIREEIIEKLSALPLIPWAKNSKNAVPRKLQSIVKNADILHALHKACMQDEGRRFREAGYNYRSKEECLISAVKENFNPYVRTVKGNGPENEVLLKLIAQNIHWLLLAGLVYGLDFEYLLSDDYELSQAA